MSCLGNKIIYHRDNAFLMIVKIVWLFEKVCQNILQLYSVTFKLKVEEVRCLLCIYIAGFFYKICFMQLHQNTELLQNINSLLLVQA